MSKSRSSKGLTFPIPDAPPAATAADAPALKTGIPVPTPAPTSNAPRDLRLTCLNGPRRGAVHRVKPGRCLVGRADPMAGVQPDLDLTEHEAGAKQTTVSRAHAEIERRDTGWVVRDLSSRHATRVGASKLTAGEDHALNTGDRVAFGGLVFEVEVDIDE